VPAAICAPRWNVCGILRRFSPHVGKRINRTAPVPPGYSQGSQSKTSPAVPPPSQGQRPATFHAYRSDQNQAPRKRRQARIDESTSLRGETIDARPRTLYSACVVNAHVGLLPWPKLRQLTQRPTINSSAQITLTVVKIRFVVSVLRIGVAARAAPDLYPAQPPFAMMQHAGFFITAMIAR